ncbi:YnjH family protein [Pantoea tagorei]
MRYFAGLYFIAALVSGPVVASPSHGHQQAYGAGGSADVVVDMPPEVWTQNQTSAPSCQQCCIFENRNYSEGAVVKSEGVLLQCARDEKVLGTNPLIWKIVK